MYKYLAFFFLGLLVITPGCASKWSLVVDSPTERPAWPDDSNGQVATYIGTIRGFKETGTTISTVLRSFAFGNRAEDYTIVRPVSAAVGPDNRLAIADIGRSCIHLYIPRAEIYQVTQSG